MKHFLIIPIIFLTIPLLSQEKSIPYEFETALIWTCSPQNGIAKIDLQTGDINQIENHPSLNFMPTGDIINGNFYTVQYADNKLYMIKEDGSVQFISELPDVTDITGMAYNHADGKVYLSGHTGGDAILHTLDMQTYQTQVVGTLSETNYIIALACSTGGQLYAIGFDDKLHSVNAQTAAMTEIGELGVELNYAQSIGYDHNKQKLYGTLYTTEGYGAFYEINTSNGTANEIQRWGSQYQNCAFAVQKIDGPYLMGTFPANGEESVSLNTGITLFFLNEITEENFALISLEDAGGNAEPINCSLNPMGNNKIDISHEGLKPDTEYTLTVPTAAVSDGTDFLHTEIRLSFTTESANTSKEQIAAQISLFPNPTDGIFFIESKGNEISELKIRDISGKILPVPFKQKEKLNQIDLSAQPAGIYFLKIRANGKIINKKIIKK